MARLLGLQIRPMVMMILVPVNKIMIKQPLVFFLKKGVNEHVCWRLQYECYSARCQAFKPQEKYNAVVTKKKTHLVPCISKRLKEDVHAEMQGKWAMQENKACKISLVRVTQVTSHATDL